MTDVHKVRSRSRSPTNRGCDEDCDLLHEVVLDDVPIVRSRSRSPVNSVQYTMSYSQLYKPLRKTLVCVCAIFASYEIILLFCYGWYTKNYANSKGFAPPKGLTIFWYSQGGLMLSVVYWFPIGGFQG